MNPDVDFYFKKEGKWKDSFIQLRKIILSCGLTEALKWGQACYMHDGKNIVLIHGFKEYCAVLFFKGSLLKDTDNILIQQSDNVQAARQIRFTDVSEVKKLATTLKAYIYQAIEVEKSGLKVILKKTEQYPIPQEFQMELDKSRKLKKAFESLTPGRQRAYLLHFCQPKQSKTRISRIQNYLPHILNGKGLSDI